MRNPIARSLVLNWSILTAEGRGSLAFLMVRRWAHCWRKLALKMMKRTTSHDFDFLFQKGVWHHPSLLHMYTECTQSGPVENYCQEDQKVMPLCNQGGILIKLLYWAVTRPAYQQMITCKNASYTVFWAWGGDQVPHTSIDFLFFSFFAPVSSPSLPLCCLLKCAVQQEKGKIILLPAMQDGSQKAGVKCSVSFLKLL